MPPPTPAWSREGLLDVIARHWGFRDLRPLQDQAMAAVLGGKDSLVVLPTGGGKSLCYQAPAVYRGGTTVVVSPLIALMKDQVDGLRACGIAAAQIDSSLSAGERWAHEMDLRQGEVRLLFVSPERLTLPEFCALLQKVGVQSFAIDEAHCISSWGHDFRPEYRQLRKLRETFSRATFHAYTATATEQVRRDVIAQLGLKDPVVLVGNFDRPNLTYRVLPRHDLDKQVGEVLDRHPGEAGIIYCLRKRDVDELAAALKKKGVSAQPYHAGMSSEERQEAQAAFSEERCAVVVATVAFGMGIDRSNVRFVLHTAMPKSVEQYQQESGRAGRDGLEAECVLLHSGADYLTWKSILQKSAAEPGVDAAFLPNALKHLEDMDRYCRGAVCRHKALVQYFGQALPAASCNACDLCLGDTEEVADAQVVAQKILSCVARVKEGFGIGHVVAVLRGAADDRVRKRGHDKLTTYGLLKGHREADVRDWVYQLISQGALLQAGDEYPLLRLNDASWAVMRGERKVRLIQVVRRKKGEKPQKSKAQEISWEGVDQGLFTELGRLRRELATERQVPPYVIFNDATLRELARLRPSSPERMRLIYGVGDVKLRDFGGRFLDRVAAHCRQHGLAQDVTDTPRPAPVVAAAPTAGRPVPRHVAVFDLFRRGAGLDDAARQTGLKRNTLIDHLVDYVRLERPASISAWVGEDAYRRVAAAARENGTDQPRPLFLALGEKVPYDDVRLVIAHLHALADEASAP
jgi:ATP-dependent DNA helicase RecQ